MILRFSFVVTVLLSSNFTISSGLFNSSIINPYVFFPCLVKLCDSQFGCFDPMVVFPRHIIGLPPVSVCPEIHRKNTIRFALIDREWELISPKQIIHGSKVSIFIHGIGADYDNLGDILIPLSSLHEFDYAIAVDWHYLSFPYSMGRIPFRFAWTAVMNALLVGRTVCELGHWLVTHKHISPGDVLIVGYSAGSEALAGVGDYCWEKHRLLFGRFVGKNTAYQIHFPSFWLLF